MRAIIAQGLKIVPSMKIAFQRNWLRNGTILFFLLINAVFFCKSFIWGGPWPVTHEMLHPLVRLFEFDFALQGGGFPVRWCDNLCAGYGYPFFNFYPPFSFILAEIFLRAGLGLAGSWKLVVLILSWLGAVGVYGLTRPLSGRFGALVAALVYLFAPYHILTLYVRGNIPEFTALCVLPFLFWMTRLSMKRMRGWRGPLLPLAALSVAFLLLSHLLTAYMAAFNLFLWALFCSGIFMKGGIKFSSPSFWKRLLIPAGIAIFGAAIAAFFWVPALLELRFCRPVILTDYIRVQDHFVYPWQFVYPSWGWGLSLPGADDGISFQLGVVMWVLIAIAVSRRIAGRAGRGKSLLWFSLIMLGLHLFLMTRFSMFLWSLIPGAMFMQFPWRLLIPATFWGSLVSGLTAGETLRALRSKAPSFRRVIGVLLLVSPALAVVFYLRPIYFFDEVPVYRAARLREIMTNTTADEYLPRWVEKKPERPSSWNIHLEGKGRAWRRESAPGYHRFMAQINEPQKAAFDVFWFPGWNVLIDGEWIESRPLYPYGLIEWDMPSGARDVEIRFSDPPLRRSANMVSLISVILALLWLIIFGVRSISSLRSRTGRRNH